MDRSWSRTTRYFVLTIVLIGFVWFVAVANDLIVTLAISALLAFILNPAVSFVNTRTKLSRNWVVLTVYLLSLAGLVTVGVIFIPVIPEQLSGLAIELDAILTQLEQNATSIVLIPGFEIPIYQILHDSPILSADFVQPDVILGLVQNVSTNFGWTLVVLVTTFYLLQDWPSLREWLFSFAPASHQSDARRLYEEIRSVWYLYFRGQIRLMFIIGILTGISSAAVGLPGAVAFGVLAGLFDILLSVGPAIIMVIATAVAWFSGSTFLAMSNGWFAILVLAIYGLIQALENIWLRPRIMATTLRIHPAVVFIAIIASLALAGVVVALIIIPVLGSFGILGRYIYCRIFNIEPWPELEAHTPVPPASDPVKA